MSSPQLWAPVPQRPQPSAAEKLNNARNDILPGTWLQLSPIASAAVSPSLQAEAAGEIKEDLTLRPASEKFLTNNFVSRSSSMSSEVAAPLVSRHPPLAPKFHVSPSVERREMAVSRAGGLGSIFGGN